MADMQIVAAGHNLIAKAKWNDVEEVKRCVIAAYGSGNSSLTPPQQAAIAAIAWSMQLDPSPGTGHLYAWIQGGKFYLTIGYQGYLFKAQQQHQIYYNPPRSMTDEERMLHGVAAGDVGAICELYTMERAKIAKEMGLPLKPIIGSAVWKKGSPVPQGRTPLWVAGKNALKDSLRQLGLGFGSVTPPVVDGFSYNWEEDTYIENDPSKVVEPPKVEQPIEGELSEEIATALRESREQASKDGASEIADEPPAQTELMKAPASTDEIPF